MINVSNIIETALLLLVAYLLGCIIGYTLRRLTARPIPLQGDAAQPATVAIAPVPQPAPVQRELSAAARLAMASPPETEAPPAVQAVVPAQAQTVSVPSGEPVIAAPAKSTPSVAKPKLSKVVPTMPIAAAPVAAPRPQRKPDGEAQAKSAVPIAMKPVETASPVKKLAAKPAATPVIVPVAAEPIAKPKSKSVAKKPTDPRPAGLVAPRAGGADDLKQIKGIGPKIEQTLNGLGIFHFDQLSKLNKANVAWLDEHLGFKGRVTREAWLDQAKALVKPKK